MKKSTELFYSKQANEKLHPGLEYILKSAPHEPAKRLINKYYSLMPTKDENFVQQFRTTGFDSRTFEIGLFAFLHSQNCDFHSFSPSPDFQIARKGILINIEATTTNPAKENQFKNTLKDMVVIDEKELQDKIFNEVPIRFGSPLFSKVKKEYWKQEHCEGKPLVLAIQAFHEGGSLFYSDTALMMYLYGLRHYPTWTEEGELIVNQDTIRNHQFEDKVIPSNFFGQPNTEFISAVMFSNILTLSKFVRMAFQSGDRNGEIVNIVRSGTCYNPSPNAGLPLPFEYSLNNPPHVETWGEGLHIMHNPNAKHPLPFKYFDGVTETYLKDGKTVTDLYGFHPFTSMSMNSVKSNKKRKE